MTGSALVLVSRYAPMRLPLRIPTAGLNGVVFSVALFLRRSIIKRCVSYDYTRSTDLYSNTKQMVELG